MTDKVSLGDVNGFSDASLVDLFNSGYENAFTILSDRYFKLIRSIASRYNISGLEPEDLTQEGLLGLLSAVKSYSSERGASFKTYAGLCINRRIITLLKRSGGNKNKALNDYVSLYDESLEQSVTDEGVNPEEVFISHEGVNLLKKQISSCLSTKEKRVLSLYLAGESYNNISHVLDISPKAVDNALQRVRSKLKRHISDMPH